VFPEDLLAAPHHERNEAVRPQESLTDLLSALLSRNTVTTSAAPPVLLWSLRTDRPLWRVLPRHCEHGGAPLRSLSRATWFKAGLDFWWVSLVVNAGAIDDRRLGERCPGVSDSSNETSAVGDSGWCRMTTNNAYLRESSHLEYRGERSRRYDYAAI
jgi:hypothetical protein